jgi:hypothetical protein
MEYIYSPETNARKNIVSNEIFDTKQIYNFLHILCYHVTDTIKYPFLQFMLEKIPFCNNFIKEQFTIPFILFDNHTNIEEMVLKKVRETLKSIGCEDSCINNNMYKGIILEDETKPYALVNITGIDIEGLNLWRNSSHWFALPSEIVNIKSICNIDIAEEVTELFIKAPNLGILTNPETLETYILPDAVYSGGEMKQVEFNSVFGNRKSKEYDLSGEYYYFFKSFKDAVRYGGWSKYGGTDKIDMENKTHTHNSGGRLIIENEYGRYINGGINRYALFIQDKMYMETSSKFILDDKSIELEYPEPTITICYSGIHEIRPDILVKRYEYFVSLSFHTLNKILLDDKYIEANKNKYMIR